MKNKLIYKTIIITLATLIVVSITSIFVTNNSRKPLRTITVHGVGVADTPIDIMSYDLKITTENKTGNIEDAKDKHFANINKLTNFLESQALKDEGIQLINYDISKSIYLCSNKDQCTSINDKITNTASIKITSTTSAHNILDKIMEMDIGVNWTFGPLAYTRKENEMYDKARAQAIMNAKEKATFISKQANTKLGKMISIKENGPDFDLSDLITTNLSRTIDTTSHLRNIRARHDVAITYLIK